MANPINSPTATLTHVEVARVVFTYWCRGNSKHSVRHEIERRAEILANTWSNETAGLHPQTGAFLNPRLVWLNWQLVAPGTHLGWCGAFQISWDADKLDNQRGCIWPIQLFKQFIRRLTNAVSNALPERPLGDDSRLEIDPNPFLWTVAIGTQPEMEWTADNLRQHARSLIALTIARTHEWPVYTDREIEAILDSNLAFTNHELQLLHYNTGFLYTARERLEKRNALTYLDDAVIVPNAVLRATRSCIMKFCMELTSHAREWLEQRVRQRNLNRQIQRLLRHTQAAIDILGQVEQQFFEITHEIGHRQAVFHRLCERYGIGPLADGLRHQIQQMQGQVTDLSEQMQSRSLNLLKLLTLGPAIYAGLKILNEYGPLLIELPWREWWHKLFG